VAAAIVVASAVVMIPATTAIVVTKAAAIVVTAATVPVAAPPRVPEIAGAPLRERPRLSLSDGSRSQAGESKACSHY
jgi:hypothetical protein